MSFRIFIDGEAGTTGLKVAARLQTHPHVQMLHIDDAQRKDLQTRLQLMQDSDITILCLPDEAAHEAVALADGDASIRFIDASTAHRLDNSWVYGFPELTTVQRSMIAAASRIANPGCYPTGFLALAKPLIASGMLPADSRLSVPAISGYSGGGKSMIAAHDRGELALQFSYGTNLSHKHLAEMTHYAGLTTPPIFMPSVGDFYAGMLVHLPLHADQFAGAVEANQLYQLYADWYAAAPLVRMGAARANDENTPKMLAADALADTDSMEIFVFSDAKSQQFWLVARLDNLGKGASGAAVQNMNIALGIDESVSLAA
jgi:N-acetyl-gamma-glutamyl-phosphate reductase